MNAYELAEKAEGLAYEIPADWSSGEPKNVATDIAAMLRQQADRIAELEKVIQHGIKAFGEIQNQQLKNKFGISISTEEYQKTHEGFSTIAEVIAKHEAIPSRKEAIDKAREWLKDYRIDSIVVEPQAKPLSDEEINQIADQFKEGEHWTRDTKWVIPESDFVNFARAIEERHGIK